jgi:hypothetical protein
MRGKLVAVFGCLAPLTGCHIYQNAARIMVHEPLEYFDEQHLERQLRKDARHAWAEVCRQYPKRTFTDDFVEGFCDGYADYLDYGGTAQIPAVPPFRYRRASFLNPEGHERIRQYFLGFKYGMDVAIATGCRTFLTIPVVLPELPPPSNPNIVVLPNPPETSAPLLPTPRPIVPAPAGPPKAPEQPAAPSKEPTSPEPAAIPAPPTPVEQQLPVGTVPSHSRSSAPPVNEPRPSESASPVSEAGKTRPLFPVAAPEAPGSEPPIRPMNWVTPITPPSTQTTPLFNR